MKKINSLPWPLLCGASRPSPLVTAPCGCLNENTGSLRAPGSTQPFTPTRPEEFSEFVKTRPWPKKRRRRSWG